MNFTEELNEMDIPVLVIAGDMVQAVVNKSKEIVENLVNGELLVVKDSFDPTNLCQPEIVNEAILQFSKEKTFRLRKFFHPNGNFTVNLKSALTE